MLVLLNVFGLSASSLVLSAPTDPLACFDVKYDDGTAKLDTTYQGKGHYLAFRVIENEIKSDLQLVKWSENNATTYNEIEVKFYETIENENILKMNFDVTNNGYFPKKIDLGLFADSGFVGDNSVIDKRKDGRGFRIKRTDKFMYYTIITSSEGSFPTVDTLYFTNMDETETTDPYKFPYFNDGSDTKTTGDSVFAFSWLNREILPGETVSFGCFMLPGLNAKTPCRIIDETAVKDFYSKNEDVDIVFTILDSEVGEVINYRLSYTGGDDIDGSFMTSADKLSEQFSHKINVNNGPVIEYTITAAGMDQYHSNTITGKLIVSSQPTIKLTQKPLDKYYLNKKIELKTEVGEGATKICYRFNNSKVHETTELSTFSFDFPPQIKPGSSYTFSIWSANQYGVKSQIETFTFNYINEEEPKQEEKPEEDTKKPGENTKTKPGTTTTEDETDKEQSQKEAEEKKRKEEEKKKKTIIAVSVSCAVVVVVIIIIVVGVFMMKKSGEGNYNDFESKEANGNETPTEAGAVP